MRKKGKNIPANAMIVEDEKDLCYLLEFILKKENLTTTCANSISEAKSALNTIQPDVLFLDNNLPDGSGKDFIGDIKSIYPSAKIIMITAFDSPADIESAFKNGADYFISKPFSVATIKNMLNILSLGCTG